MFSRYGMTSKMSPVVGSGMVGRFCLGADGAGGGGVCFLSIQRSTSFAPGVHSDVLLCGMA